MPIVKQLLAEQGNVGRWLGGRWKVFLVIYHFKKVRSPLPRCGLKTKVVFKRSSYFSGFRNDFLAATRLLSRDFQRLKGQISSIHQGRFWVVQYLTMAINCSKLHNYWHPLKRSGRTSEINPSLSYNGLLKLSCLLKFYV